MLVPTKVSECSCLILNLQAKNDGKIKWGDKKD